MSKVYKIEYVDAEYSYEKSINVRKGLVRHEAYGYVKNKKDNIIVGFIKAHHKDGGEDNFLMGLVMPKEALISINKKVKIPSLQKIKIGTRISVIWKDIVFFESIKKEDCPVMYTEGIIVKKNNDCIIIKNPETIRMVPLPVINHPGSKPTFYRIPKGFIKEIESI